MSKASRIILTCRVHNKRLPARTRTTPDGTRILDVSWNDGCLQGLGPARPLPTCVLGGGVGQP